MQICWGRGVSEKSAAPPPPPTQLDVMHHVLLKSGRVAVVAPSILYLPFFFF
jgi:hypothetical protein